MDGNGGLAMGLVWKARRGLDGLHGGLTVGLAGKKGIQGLKLSSQGTERLAELFCRSAVLSLFSKGYMD